MTVPKSVLVSRRKVLKAGFVTGSVIISGVSINAVAMETSRPADLALFIPSNSHSQKFAETMSTRGIRTSAVDADLTAVLTLEIFPLLPKKNVKIVGSTAGHVAFVLQEMLRDRGFAITKSHHTHAQGSKGNEPCLCAVDLNCLELVEWSLDRVGLQFRN